MYLKTFSWWMFLYWLVVFPPIYWMTLVSSLLLHFWARNFLNTPRSYLLFRIVVLFKEIVRCVRLRNAYRLPSTWLVRSWEYGIARKGKGRSYRGECILNVVIIGIIVHRPIQFDVVSTWYPMTGVWMLLKGSWHDFGPDLIHFLFFSGHH